MKRFYIAYKFSVDFFYITSLIFGLCPYILDKKHQRVTTSNWLSIYSLIFNGSYIVFVLPLITIAYERNEMSDTVLKDFTLFIDVVNIFIKVISIALSLVVFFKERVNFQIVVNAILTLNSTTFKANDSAGERIHLWFLKMVCLKMLVTACLSWFFFGLFHQNFKVKSWAVIGLFICNGGIFTFQQYSIFYFYTAVCFVCKFYET